MKFIRAISAAFLLLVPAYPLHAQPEPLSDADKALFDDLQVSEEAEKTARERIAKSEKPPPPPPPELPDSAATLLDRLAIYEASLYGITDEIVTRSRKNVSGELIKLSSAMTEPGKTELIAAAKSIEGLPAGAELPPAVTDNDFPGEWIYNAGDKRWFYGDGKVKTNSLTGTWRWLNQSSQVVIADYTGSDYVDIMRLVTKPGKPPTLECVNQNVNRWTLSRGQSEPGKPALPAEANKMVSAARGQESHARTKSLQQTQEKRERVAAWLVEKAKTAPPAAAQKLLESAKQLRSAAADPAKGNSTRRNPDTFRGKIYTDHKRRAWEFLPNGIVKCNGLSRGNWEWAKSGNDSCFIISSGGAGKAENPILVRQSGSTAGVLHFITFDDKFEAKLKP